MVLQKVATRVSTVAVVNRKETALGPTGDVSAVSRFVHVQNDRYPVFVVLSLNPLVGVGRVRCYETMAFCGELCKFKVFKRVLLRLEISAFREFDLSLF